MKSTIFAAVAAIAAGVQAAQVPVQVGMEDDQYTPLSVNASPGDTILFQFHTSSHNVIESAGTAVDTACEPMANGFATQIMQDGSSYTLPINSTDPVYIHCGPHCLSNGMVFVVNPPSSTAAQDFQSAAMGVAPASSSSSASSTASTTMNSSDGAMTLSSTSLTPLLAGAGAALVGFLAVL